MDPISAGMNFGSQAMSLIGRLFPDKAAEWQRNAVSGQIPKFEQLAHQGSVQGQDMFNMLLPYLSSMTQQSGGLLNGPDGLLSRFTDQHFGQGQKTAEDQFRRYGGVDPLMEQMIAEDRAHVYNNPNLQNVSNTATQNHVGGDYRNQSVMDMMNSFITGGDAGSATQQGVGMDLMNMRGQNANNMSSAQRAGDGMARGGWDQQSSDLFDFSNKTMANGGQINPLAAKQQQNLGGIMDRMGATQGTNAIMNDAQGVRNTGGWTGTGAQTAQNGVDIQNSGGFTPTGLNTYMTAAHQTQPGGGDPYINQILQNGGRRPETDMANMFALNELSDGGYDPRMMDKSVGAAGNLLDSGGRDDLVNQLAQMAQGLSGFSGGGGGGGISGGGTSSAPSRYTLIQDMMNANPQLKELLEKGTAKFGQEALMPMSRAVSSARDAAGTANEQQMRAMMGRAMARGGGPGVVLGSGMQNEGLMDMGIQGAQAESAAIREAEKNQQNLQLQDKLGSGQIANSAAGIQSQILSTLAGYEGNLDSNNVQRAGISSNASIAAANQAAQANALRLQAMQAGMGGMSQAAQIAAQRMGMGFDAFQKMYDGMTGRQQVNNNALTANANPAAQSEANALNNSTQRSNAGLSAMLGVDSNANDRLKTGFAGANDANANANNRLSIGFQGGNDAAKTQAANFGTATAGFNNLNDTQNRTFLGAMQNSGDMAKNATNRLATWGQIGRDADTSQQDWTKIGSGMVQNDITNRYGMLPALSSTIKNDNDFRSNSGILVNDIFGRQTAAASGARDSSTASRNAGTSAFNAVNTGTHQGTQNDQAFLQFLASMGGNAANTGAGLYNTAMNYSGNMSGKIGDLITGHKPEPGSSGANPLEVTGQIGSAAGDAGIFRGLYNMLKGGGNVLGGGLEQQAQGGGIYGGG